MAKVNEVLNPDLGEIRTFSMKGKIFWGTDWRRVLSPGAEEDEKVMT